MKRLAILAAVCALCGCDAATFARFTHSASPPSPSVWVGRAPVGNRYNPANSSGCGSTIRNWTMAAMSGIPNRPLRSTTMECYA